MRLSWLSICADTQVCFELDPESGEPNENCVFAMLIQTGWDISSLASADGKGALSMDFLYRAVYPDTGPAHVVRKTHPDCLKLAAIIRNYKFKIPATTANNVINKDGEIAINTSFIRANIGNSERQYQEEPPPHPTPPISQMTGYGKGRLAKR